jgi:hypothetical protein
MEQDPIKPKFRLVPDEWERDGENMKRDIQVVIDNSKETLEPDDVAYLRDQSFVEPLPHKDRDPNSLFLRSAVPGPHYFDPLIRLGFYDEGISKPIRAVGANM